MAWYGIVWYGMSLQLVAPTLNQSSAFRFGLLRVLVALSQTEPIFDFEVGKAVGYGAKLVCLDLLGNFSSIETIWYLFQALKNPKVVPLELLVVVCVSELYCEKRALTKQSTCCQTELVLQWLSLIWQCFLAKESMFV